MKTIIITTTTSSNNNRNRSTQNPHRKTEDHNRLEIKKMKDAV